jgi:hypothetical protein
MTEQKDTTTGGQEERRGFIERRKNVVNRRLGLDRRRGPGHRRTEERRSAEEGEMSEEQFEFLMAIDQYKRPIRDPSPPGRRCWKCSRRWGIARLRSTQSLESFRKQDKEQPVHV